MKREKLTAFDALCMYNSAISDLKRDPKGAMAVVLASVGTLDNRKSHGLKFEIAEILDRAADQIGITVKLLLSRARVASVCDARAVAMTAIRWRGYTYPMIGEYMRRDHSTVIMAVRKVEASPELTARVDEILAAMDATKRALEEKPSLQLCG